MQRPRWRSGGGCLGLDPGRIAGEVRKATRSWRVLHMSYYVRKAAHAPTETHPGTPERVVNVRRGSGGVHDSLTFPSTTTKKVSHMSCRARAGPPPQLVRSAAFFSSGASSPPAELGLLLLDESRHSRILILAPEQPRKSVRLELTRRRQIDPLPSQHHLFRRRDGQRPS
jgi:hypothetical protein